MSRRSGWCWERSPRRGRSRPFSAATTAVTGHATLALPWPLVLTVVAGAFLVTGVTSVLTSWSATRGTPVTLLAARD